MWSHYGPLGRSLGANDRGEAIDLGDPCEALSVMIQSNIVGQEGLAEWGDTGGSEDQGGTGGARWS